MTNIDINKEGLLTMVKRINSENTSLPKKFPIESIHNNQKILSSNLFKKKINYSPKIILNNSTNNTIKKTTIFKNKFLEKNNIQINEQNVLNLISERRKKKFAISKSKTYKNNNNNNLKNYSNYEDKIIKGRMVYINLDEKMNKNKTKVNDKYITYKNKIKKITNSNSEHFDKNFNKNLENNFLDMNSLIKNSKSFFKILDNNNKINSAAENNINNNININININGNINNSKNIRNIFRPNEKYIQHYPTTDNNRDKIIITDRIKNKKNYEHNSNYIINENCNHKINLKSNIYPEKIRKNNNKIFYLNNINNLEENDYDNNNNNIKRKNKIEDIDRHNTVNINFNFISNPKDDNVKSKRMLTNNYVSYINNIKKKNNNINNNIIPIQDEQNNNLRNSINFSTIKSNKLENMFNNNNNSDINNKTKKYTLRNKTYKNKYIKKSNTTFKYDINNEEIEKIINNKKDIIQLEDLLILEGKFCHLIDCLQYENPLPKMCIEWWNFYIYSSYFGKFPKLFPKRLNNNNTFSDYQIAHDSILFELLSIVLTYKILTEIDLRNSLINNLMELINEIHQSFLIECDYILSKISNTSMSNLWIKKLKNLILSKKNWILNNNHLKLLHQRNIIIHDIIQHLIGIIPKNNNIDIDIDTLSYFNNNISNLHLIELSDYFSSEIAKENLKISKAFTHIIKKNYYVNRISNKNNNIVTPYLPLKSYKDQKYTLVLDLDETLISFRIGIHGRGIIKLRPGLFDFLNKIKNKYELVVFTAGTKEYADPIIDIIEKKEKYFIKRLYRQHTIYRDNIYIKDLSKLGRDLSKIIIVDNMPQNFCLQKENGILISNYFGQDSGDNTLYLLADILLKIAQKYGRDVRNEINKYKEEIFTKITTNLDS